MPAPTQPDVALPRPAPVRCATDALRIMLLSAAQPLQHETIAFLLDRHGNGGVITIVSGTVDANSVLAVAECLATAAEGVPQAAALVLGSVRPAGRVLPGDIDRWLEASAVAAAHEVELIEWFVIGAAGVQCPRDLLGEPERWSHLTDVPSA